LTRKSQEKTPVEAFVDELRKTKGGVTVTEEANGDTVVRTRDGDTHTFPAGWKPLDEKAD
jgi:hypothetical protein